MNLDQDLQRILNVGAKVYNTKAKRQGKVHSNNQVDVMVDYGKGDYKTYPIDEFTSLLTSDVIVSNSRVTLGDGENFKIKPREIQPINTVQTLIDINGNGLKHINGILISSPITSEPDLKEPCLTSRQPAELGYINFATGRFSTEPKKGYTKVEFRKATEKVTLELTSEQIEALKEMGLM